MRDILKKNIRHALKGKDLCNYDNCKAILKIDVSTFTCILEDRHVEEIDELQKSNDFGYLDVGFDKREVEKIFKHTIDVNRITDLWLFWMLDCFVDSASRKLKKILLKRIAG